MLVIFSVILDLLPVIEGYKSKLSSDRIVFSVETST